MKFQPLKYTAEQIQEKINIVHGTGKITLDVSTYTGVKNKAKFIDIKYGEWWTQPYLVAKGFHHPKYRTEALNKSIMWTLEEIQNKISEIHNNRYWLVPETYSNSKNKTWFYDNKKKEWFETSPQYILQGCDNPSDRADKIRVANTPLLQKLGKERTKYIGTSGETITDLCNQYGVASSGFIKLAREVSSDFAIKAFKSHLKEGKYQKYQSNLEEYFKELFKESFPALEKWNKQPSEVNTIKCHPDFKFVVNDKPFYVDVHGLFFHSEHHVSATYHQERAKVFSEAKITYLQFFADEVFNKPEIIKSMILSRLGIIQNKYFARKLTFNSSISSTESKLFFNSNHLMGHKSGRTIGLYDKTELVCALSYKIYKDRIEIERFCTKLNTSCAGGFSKLVAYLKQFNQAITSYCDLRYSDGHSYESTGFIKVGETLGWNWTNGNKRFNRLACKATGDKTEKENARDLGLFKIFDAGQRKYNFVV